MNHPTNLLVTGGAGFIGSAFIRRALARGYRVVALDGLTYAGQRRNLEGVLAPGRCDLVLGGIRDRALVRDLLTRHGIGVLINFAAESHVDRSIVDAGAFVETNVLGTFCLLDACLDYVRKDAGAAARDFRYVQISTDEVFGSLEGEGLFSEESRYDPRSPYAASKAGADHLVRAWGHTYGLPVIVTHCSNNYGPRQHPEKLIPHMIIRALAGEPLPVYGDGMNVRDWVHVDDHCGGVLLALERGEPGESYCFGGGNQWTNIDLVREICRLLDARRPRPGGGSYAGQIAFVEDRPGHDRRYGLDCAKAMRTLGFSVARDFRSGLAETVDWYLANEDWWGESRKRGVA